MNLSKQKIGYILIAIITIVSAIVLFNAPKIEQPLSYHNFSDADTIFGINNFWNVISNLPFLLTGLYGIYRLNDFCDSKRQYLLFFAGTSLVSIGSGYYHLNPTNETLIWDRLPMTIAFMALFPIVISEFIDNKKGQLMLIPCIILGFASVYYWVHSGDLRPYIFIQFYPILVIPVIIYFFKSRYTLTYGYWLLFLIYILAKTSEYYDKEIHEQLTVISGHTLKHFFAAIGIAILLDTYLKRKEVNQL